MKNTKKKNMNFYSFYKMLLVLNSIPSSKVISEYDFVDKPIEDKNHSLKIRITYTERSMNFK